MEKFPLRGDHVTLAQALKALGRAGSGGEAKVFVREGHASVNGVVETQPGRKLRAGDVFSVVDGEAKLEWQVTAGPPA